MRRTLALLSIAILALVTLTTLSRAEVTRTLKIEIPPSAGGFAIENLAGEMRVVPGTGDAVVAVATVHAESDDLASAVRFEKVDGDPGFATYRVRYPYDRHTTFRYPAIGGGESGEGFWSSLFGGSNTSTTYDDRRVKVSGSSGALLYADVEIQVPRRAVEGKFRNMVGRLHAREIEGRLLFDTASGDVTLEKVRGEIKADTGSGDVSASDVEGSFDCDTGSGDCDLKGFRGEAVSCDVGSGTIHLKTVTARRVKADTGSGDVQALDVDAEEFEADTGSGDVELAAAGPRLSRIKADTGSGDVILRLGADASFEALADQGSGNIVNRYADATPIVKDKVVIGYRRGAAPAQIRIDVDTGSGDLTLEPGI